MAETMAGTAAPNRDEVKVEIEVGEIFYLENSPNVIGLIQRYNDSNPNAPIADQGFYVPVSVRRGEVEVSVLGMPIARRDGDIQVGLLWLASREERTTRRISQISAIERHQAGNVRRAVAERFKEFWLEVIADLRNSEEASGQSQ